jgi:hypothetical protein
MPHCSAYDLTVVIPTRNRPKTLSVAVESAISQKPDRIEVVLVDDCSDFPVELVSHPRVRSIRMEKKSGPAAARNAGLAVAKGKWVTFLDDDDQLLPGVLERCLQAVADSNLPPPVAVISGIEVVDEQGKVVERRLPPSHPKGEHFSLEPLPLGRSHVTKNTLFAERELLLSLGGFDSNLAACEWIDLFFRLNPVCSILGLESFTYQLKRSPGPHFSRNLKARETGFKQLLKKHQNLFATHPKGCADALLGEARMALATGARLLAVRNLFHAFLNAPCHTTLVILNLDRGFRLLRSLDSSG